MAHIIHHLFIAFLNDSVSFAQKKLKTLSEALSLALSETCLPVWESLFLTNSKHLLHMRCCRSRPPKLSKLALASEVPKFQEVSITTHLFAVRMVGSARPQIGAEASKVASPMAKTFISGIYQLGKMTLVAY